MTDPRGEYARRYVDLIGLRQRQRRYWDVELACPAVPPRRLATLVDAWWEALSLALVPRSDDRRAA